MTEHGSFYRKITYLVLIAVLLFPISQLGAPATVEDEGGRLARLRTEYELGQSNLGDIDPASETIRLATLGMRGVAVSMLWSKANEYKMKEDWTNFRATLDQLLKLQPYFIKVWLYQSWNLTYNVSVELDDVRDRFHYVLRGIEFLKKGIKYNRDSPYLLSELGWFIGNKIGRADEHKEYRRLFKDNDDFHPADRPPEQRDNWLVSRSWYENSVLAVDVKKESLGQKNPTIFFSDPAKSQINYGEAIEKEGTFGEKAKSAWATGGRLWKEFGSRDLKSTMGFNIRLGDLDRLAEETNELVQQLEQLSVASREAVSAAKRAKLTDEQRALLDGPQTGLSNEQSNELYEAQKLTEVTPEDIADHIAEVYPKKVAEARRLAKKIMLNQNKIRLTQTNRGVVNFDYWKTRCELEQTQEALRARELAYSAQRVFKIDADLLEAKRLFEESFVMWSKAFEQFPSMPLDSTTGSDIMDYVEQYTTVLQQLDQSLEDDENGSKFPLWQLVESNDSSGAYAVGVSKFLHPEDKPDQPSSDSESDDSNSDEETKSDAEATEQTAAAAA